MRANCCHAGESSSNSTIGRAETASVIVAIITLADMIAEIVFGLVSGSLALLSDGIHMGTHAFALFITAASYFLARKHRQNPGFSFGTGKVGVLGGYTNALILGITAFFMVYESVRRFLRPASIAFDEAIIVAIIGLAVNLVCALILGRSGAGHHHGDHEHEHETGHHHDANLRGAFLHVATDALTSVLAIGALLCGKFLGWAWLDAAVGLLGAALILKWAAGLLASTAFILLDFGNYDREIAAIRARVEALGATVRDIHIWRYAEDERSLILSVSDPLQRNSSRMQELLGDLGDFQHVTLEVLP